MKRRIHPKYNKVKLILTDGSTYLVLMPMNKSMFKLDSDTKSHHVWSDMSKIDFFESGSQMAKFKERFKMF